MKRAQKVKTLWIATGLAILAGILYNSWPLGFLLNPQVSFGGGMASELEGLHQPYNWVFVLLDIVTGALVLTIVVMLWRERMREMGKIALISFALFGLFTIVDALLPMPCAPSIAHCASWTVDPLLFMHGLASVGGAVFLFVSAAIVWHLRQIRRGTLVMRLLLASWGLFGVLSIFFFFVPGPGYLSQDYYLILCGLWVALMPAMLELDNLQARRRLAPKRVRAV